MSKTNLTSRALHIALSTYPQKDDEAYIQHIDKMYQDYIKDRKLYSELPDLEERFLYKPLKYHLFGHFDIAFISIIDSYKFAQRVFDDSRNGSHSYSNVSYQVQCGTILGQSRLDSEILMNLISNNFDLIYSTYPFILIVNLKLNNGLLIGNGNIFIDLVLNKIETLFSKYKGTKYIISNSYSWSDLTIIMFSSEIVEIIHIILEIRKLIVSDLFKNVDEAANSIFVKNSLLKQKFKYSPGEIINSHIFLDSQSNMGIAYDLFRTKNTNSKGFLKQELLTNVEWQIKPGHFKSFFDEINKDKKLFGDQIFYKHGKTDFITMEINPNTLESNQDIYFAVRSNGVKEHIRKLKTKPIFSIANPELVDQGSLCVKGIAKKLADNKIDNLNDINKALKKINLSRQLRTKIQKVFHNYNNGITDSISYIYFIDFYGFLDFFKTLILTCGDNLDSLLNGHCKNFKTNGNEHFFNIIEIEETFDSILQSFEEAFIDRFLNNYNFEELNDFKIDFNTSVNQIITTYDSIIKELSATLLMDKPKILVRQNELNTKSNFVSINFNVFHLIEPSLVFNTVVKELLNSLKDNFTSDIDNKEIFKNSESEIRADFKKSNGTNLFLADFDLQYFKIDVIKYFYTFNGNSDLYFFWSWVYFLQSTSSYTTIGYVNKIYFDRELFRVMLTIATFDSDKIVNDELKCPVPELYNYWEKSYVKIKDAVLNLLKIQSFTSLVKTIIKIYKDEIIKVEMPNLENGVHRFLMINPTLQLEKKKPMIDDLNRKKADGFIESKLNNYLLDHRNIGLLTQRWESLELSYIVYHSDLEEGISVDYNNPNSQLLLPSEPSSTMFFNRISYTTLLWYYNKMNHEINLLRRNYETGEPMENFIEQKKSSYIFIDPQGDFFIVRNEARKETMRFKHAVYQSLWHLGLTIKLNFFKS